MGPEHEARNPVGATTHIRKATRSDDGAGELGPPMVRTVHSSGGALWAMSTGWDLPSAAHVHVVVVVAVILRWVLFIVRTAHRRCRYWQMLSALGHRAQHHRTHKICSAISE